MKKIFKIGLYFLGVLVILCGTAYAFRNKLIISAVETFVPKMTGTPVTLGDVNFQPLRGSIVIKNLAVGNPQGFSTGDVFSLGEITVRMVPGSLMKNKIIINEISIDKVSATYELALNGTSNIAVIQKNVAGEAKSSAPVDTAAKKDTSAAPSKQVVIKQFTLKNAKVAAEFAGAKITLPLPDISLKDLGENKPSTAAEIFATVMNVFSKETVTAVAKAANETVKSGAKKIGDFLEQVF